MSTKISKVTKDAGRPKLRLLLPLSFLTINFSLMASGFVCQVRKQLMPLVANSFPLFSWLFAAHIFESIIAMSRSWKKQKKRKIVRIANALPIPIYCKLLCFKALTAIVQGLTQISHVGKVCQLGQAGGSRPVVRRPHCQLREGRGQGWGGDWEVAGGWRPGGALQWERWGVRTGRTWVIDEEMFVLDRALIRRVFIPATTTRLDLLGLILSPLLSLRMMISHEISYLHLMY